MQVTPLHRFLTKGILFCSLLVLAAGCKTYSEDDKQSFDGKISSYISRKNWDMEKSESGLYVQLIEEGTGDEPVIGGSEVEVSYKGTLLNGTTFDQTPPGKPLKSQIQNLIMGFREGLAGRKAGAKLRLVVPPQLGYGDMKLDRVPANSVLIFDLELVSVR